MAHPGDEIGCIVAAVGGNAHAPGSAAPALPSQQAQAGLALSGAGCLGELALGDQAVAILDQAVASVERRLLAGSLARKARFVVGGGAVALVAAPLPMEVDVGVACAAGARWLLAFVLVLLNRPQALQGRRRPRAACHRR